MTKAIIATAAATAALTVVITIGVMSAIRPPTAAAQAPTAEPTQTPPAARYQIYYSPLARADTYLVDNQSGTVWQMQADEKGNESFNQLLVVPAPTK